MNSATHSSNQTTNTALAGQASFPRPGVVTNEVTGADGMVRKMVCEVKKGEFLRRSMTAKKTFQRGDYDRSSKTYSLIDCDDINHEIMVDPTSPVFVGFTY